MNRRGFLTGLGALIAAPAIVHAGNLMPIKVMAPTDNARLWLVEWSRYLNIPIKTILWDSEVDMHPPGVAQPVPLLQAMRHAMLRQPLLSTGLQFQANSAALQQFDQELNDRARFPVVRENANGFIELTVFGIPVERV